MMRFIDTRSSPSRAARSTMPSAMAMLGAERVEFVWTWMPASRRFDTAPKRAVRTNRAGPGQAVVRRRVGPFDAHLRRIQPRPRQAPHVVARRASGAVGDKVDAHLPAPRVRNQPRQIGAQARLAAGEADARHMCVQSDAVDQATGLPRREAISRFGHVVGGASGVAESAGLVAGVAQRQLAQNRIAREGTGELVDRRRPASVRIDQVTAHEIAHVAEQRVDLRDALGPVGRAGAARHAANRATGEDFREQLRRRLVQRMGFDGHLDQHPVLDAHAHIGPNRPRESVDPVQVLQARAEFRIH